jgi:tetratricopeptide (TPR) repeat protein
MKNAKYRSGTPPIAPQFLILVASLTALLFFPGCSTIVENSNNGKDKFAKANVLFNEGNYEAAYKENQKLFGDGTAPPDRALFNMGLISAYSLNPKKDYPKALDSFRKLLSHHPHSSLTEQAKVWVQVLEEHQKIGDERQKLVDEKRTLTRERETLSQEREKLKYTVEKSRQLDIEIERRRKQSQNR